METISHDPKVCVGITKASWKGGRRDGINNRKGEI
jgi:hypothetical protein